MLLIWTYTVLWLTMYLDRQQKDSNRHIGQISQKYRKTLQQNCQEKGDFFGSKCTRIYGRSDKQVKAQPRPYRRIHVWVGDPRRRVWENEGTEKWIGGRRKEKGKGRRDGKLLPHSNFWKWAPMANGSLGDTGLTGEKMHDRCKGIQNVHSH